MGERTQPTLPGVEETVTETSQGMDMASDPPSIESASTLAVQMSLAPAGPYDRERDVQFYLGDAGFLLLQQGMFAVMLPSDAHMPGVAVDGQPAAVKKIVVKAAVAP